MRMINLSLLLILGIFSSCGGKGIPGVVGPNFSTSEEHAVMAFDIEQIQSDEIKEIYVDQCPGDGHKK